MERLAKPIHRRPPPGRVLRRRAHWIRKSLGWINDPRGQIHQIREQRVAGSISPVVGAEGGGGGDSGEHPWGEGRGRASAPPVICARVMGEQG